MVSTLFRGYLIDQFLQYGSNQRSDQYGGSVENRCRFLLEVVETTIKVWGDNAVGIKLSPSKKNREVLNPVLPIFRPVYKGNLITNGSYTKGSGTATITSNQADLVSFGKLFIANPDLPYRLQHDSNLNEPNAKTFYGRGVNGAEVGYTDYPEILH